MGACMCSAVLIVLLRTESTSVFGNPDKPLTSASPYRTGKYAGGCASRTLTVWAWHVKSRPTSCQNCQAGERWSTRPPHRLHREQNQLPGATAAPPQHRNCHHRRQSLPHQARVSTDVQRRFIAALARHKRIRSLSHPRLQRGPRHKPPPPARPRHRRASGRAGWVRLKYSRPLAHQRLSLSLRWAIGRTTRPRAR